METLQRKLTHPIKQKTASYDRFFLVTVKPTNPAFTNKYVHLNFEITC